MAVKTRRGYAVREPGGGSGGGVGAPEPGEARGSLQMGAARQGETSGSERGSTGAWGGSGQPADGCSPPGRDERERARQHRSLGRLGAACRWVQPARARRAGASEAAPEPGEARGSLQMGAARQGETSGSERGSTGAWGGSGQPADGCSPPGRDERERARQSAVYVAYCECIMQYINGVIKRIPRLLDFNPS